MSYGLRVMGIMFQGHFNFPFLPLTFNLKIKKTPAAHRGSFENENTKSFYSDLNDRNV